MIVSYECMGKAAAERIAAEEAAAGAAEGAAAAPAAGAAAPTAEAGQPAAQFMYGMCCENGIGVEKDLSEAAGWYRRAAKAGNKQANDALMNLGFPGVL